MCSSDLGGPVLRAQQGGGLGGGRFGLEQRGQVRALPAFLGRGHARLAEQRLGQAGRAHAALDAATCVELISPAVPGAFLPLASAEELLMACQLE